MPTSETLTNKLRRAGLDFSNRVVALAAESPDISTRRMLNKVAHSVRKRYGYSDAEKESEILKCIRDGAATVSDLVDETGFPRQEISVIKRRLEDQGKVRVQKISVLKNGRPASLIFAVEEG